MELRVLQYLQPVDSPIFSEFIHPSRRSLTAVCFFNISYAKHTGNQNFPHNLPFEQSGGALYRRNFL